MFWEDLRDDKAHLVKAVAAAAAPQKALLPGKRGSSIAANSRTGGAGRKEGKSHHGKQRDLIPRKYKNIT